MSMGQSRKIVFSEGEALDLGSYSWDDHRFSDLLVRGKPHQPGSGHGCEPFSSKRNRQAGASDHHDAHHRAYDRSKTSGVWPSGHFAGQA